VEGEMQKALQVDEPGRLLWAQLGSGPTVKKLSGGQF